MTTNAISQLLELARADGIHIPDEFVSVLRTSKPGSQLHSWLEDYLAARSHETQIVISPDPQSVAKLKAATKRVEDQTRVLRAQRQQLERQSDRRNPGKTRPVSNRQVVDAQQARLINEAKTGDLVADLGTKSSTITKETDAVARDVSQTLGRDDQVFESLNRKLAASRSWDEVDQLAVRINELESTLHNIRVTALKDRLDRVYLTTLVDPSHENTVPDPNMSAESLKEDIQSLYTEIEDVVTMLNSHDHINDLQRQLEAIGQKQQQSSSEDLAQVS
jgi:hypothetical protein